MKRNNVDAALIIEVSKPIAYGQYQFEKGDKLTYDMNSNLFIYRSESYSEDEDGTETTSIIAFGVDPDFVLDNADHFTCLIKKGILDKVENDDQPEVNDTDEADTQCDTKQNGSDEDIDRTKMPFDAIISHVDELSLEELKDEVIEAMTLFSDTLKCYDLSLRKRSLGRGFDGGEDIKFGGRIDDVLSNLKWVLRAFNDEKKEAIEGEKKRAINDCIGEACDSAR